MYQYFSDKMRSIDTLGKSNGGSVNTDLSSCSKVTHIHKNVWHKNLPLFQHSRLLYTDLTGGELTSISRGTNIIKTDFQTLASCRQMLSQRTCPIRKPVWLTISFSMNMTNAENCTTTEPYRFCIRLDIRKWNQKKLMIYGNAIVTTVSKLTVCFSEIKIHSYQTTW